jgi:hypothetical protein
MDINVYMCYGHVVRIEEGSLLKIAYRAKVGLVQVVSEESKMGWMLGVNYGIDWKVLKNIEDARMCLHYHDR